MPAQALLAIAFTLSALSFAGLSRIRTEKRQVALLGISFGYMAFSCLASISLAFFAHRDFLSAPFMAFLGLFCALLGNRSFLRRYRLRPGSFRTLRTIGAILLLAVFAWLIVVSYSLVARTEPRLVESFIYNAYNATLATYLALAFLRSSKLEPRRLIVSPGHVGIDGVELTSLFSKKDLGLLSLLVKANDRPLTCKSINLNDYEACRSCDADSKASSCLRYKRTQESISSIDKLFRTMNWGKVVGPANKQEILQKGWVLSRDASISLQWEGPSEPALEPVADN
jgi:hypothetical protein